VSYSHSFNPADPPRAEIVKARINDETGRTCSHAAVVWTATPPRVDVTLDEEATGQDLADITAIVSSTDPVATLPRLKAKLCALVDAQIQDRICGTGIEWPAESGIYRSCSTCGQINTNRNQWRKSLTNLLPWPIASIDNTNIYEIETANELDAYLSAVAEHTETELKLGRFTKRDILAAETSVAAQAVYDAYIGV